LMIPGGPGIRVDTHIYAGYAVPPYYDSLLAKVIAYAPTRREAIDKMRVALRHFVVEGIKTNIDILAYVMENETFIDGRFDTGFITRLLESAK